MLQTGSYGDWLVRVCEGVCVLSGSAMEAVILVISTGMTVDEEERSINVKFRRFLRI